MTVQSSTIQTGATGVTIVGGAAATWVGDGKTINNGVHIVCSSDTNYLTRKSATLKSRKSVYDGKTFSKEKRSFELVVPKALADTTYAFNTGKAFLDFHPESSAAEILEIKMILVQAIMDSDFTSFWDVGSTV